MGELLGGGFEELTTHACQTLLYLFRVECLGDFSVDLVDDRLGRSGRRKHAVPRGGAKVFDGFAYGGGIRQHRQALGVDHAEHFHPAGTDECDRRGQALHRDLHLPSHQVGGCCCGPLVGHMGQFDAGGFAQHLADQVVEGAVASRTNVDFAWLLLGQCDQFGGVSGWEARVGHQHIPGRGDAADRLEVLDRIETRVFVKRWIDDHCAVGG